MHTPLVFIAAAVLAAALPVPSAAQTEITPGTRIRLTLLDEKHPMVGAFVRRTADSLTLEIPARSWNGVGQQPVEAVSVAIRSITRVEMSLGKKSQTGHGARTGAIVGAASGLALGLAAAADNSGWYEVGGGEIAQATLVMSAMGAGVGAIVGSLSHTDRWAPATLPELPPAPEAPMTTVTIPLVNSRF